MDFTKRAVKRLEGELDSGESVRHGIYAMPPGSIARGLSESPNVRGALRAARAKKQQQEERGDSLADRLPPENVFLTITDKRLLVHRVTKSGKPGDYVCEYGPGDVASVDSKKGRMGGGEVSIEFSDGSGVHMLVRSGQDVVRFGSTWQAVFAT